MNQQSRRICGRKRATKKARVLQPGSFDPGCGASVAVHFWFFHQYTVKNLIDF